MKVQLFLVEFSKPHESLVLSETKAPATLLAKRGTSVPLIVFVTTIAYWGKARGKLAALPGGLVSVPTCTHQSPSRDAQRLHSSTNKSVKWGPGKGHGLEEEWSEKEICESLVQTEEWKIQHGENGAVKID